MTWPELLAGSELRGWIPSWPLAALSQSIRALGLKLRQVIEKPAKCFETAIADPHSLCVALAARLHRRNSRRLRGSHILCCLREVEVFGHSLQECDSDAAGLRQASSRSASLCLALGEDSIAAAHQRRRCTVQSAWKALGVPALRPLWGKRRCIGSYEPVQRLKWELLWH